MATIRIDEEVWQALKARAEAFVDTPNDVLRRLLMPSTTTVTVTSRPKTSEPTMGRGRKSRLYRTPETEFRLPLLQALVELGGKGAVEQVLKVVHQRLQVKLKPDDFKPLPSGEVRWENTAKWERKHLVMEGLLEQHSPRGVWEITQRGRQFLSGQA